MPPPARTIFHVQMWPETFCCCEVGRGRCVALRSHRAVSGCKKMWLFLLIFLCGSFCEVDLIYFTSPLRVCPG